MLLPHLRVKHLLTALQSTRINPVLNTPGWLICRSTALVFALAERVNMPTFLNTFSIFLKFAKKRNNTTAFQNIRRIISEFGRWHPLCPEAPGKSLHCKQVKEENRAGWCSETTDLRPTQPQVTGSTLAEQHKWQEAGFSMWAGSRGAHEPSQAAGAAEAPRRLSLTGSISCPNAAQETWD